MSQILAIEGKLQGRRWIPINFREIYRQGVNLRSTNSLTHEHVVTEWNVNVYEL